VLLLTFENWVVVDRMGLVVSICGAHFSEITKAGHAGNARQHPRRIPQVCCSVLQCGAVWCSVLQCVAVCCSVQHSRRIPQVLSQKAEHTLQHTATHIATHCNTHCNTLQHTLQHTATHIAKHYTQKCSTTSATNFSGVLQCVAVRCSVVQCVAVCYIVSLEMLNNICDEFRRCVAVCCSVVQIVAVCCSVLQCGRSVLQCGTVWCSVL